MKISEIDKKFDEEMSYICACRHDGSTYSGKCCLFCYSNDCRKCIKEPIKSFYTKEILSLIKEIKVRLPKDDEGYFSMGCEEEAKIRGYNEAISEVRATLDKIVKEL